MSRRIEAGPYQPPFQPPFGLGWVEGEGGRVYPHVVDAEGRIVSFGKLKGQDSLFYDPEKAKKAAELLNSGKNYEDINVRDPK